MAISSQTRKLLWAKANGRCSICSRHLIRKASERGKRTTVGDEAHIVSRKPNGPRSHIKIRYGYDAYENLILLCKKHHTIIDDDEKKYTFRMVVRLKREHERRVAMASVSIKRLTGSVGSGTAKKQLEDGLYAKKAVVYDKLLGRCNKALAALDYSSAPFVQIHEFSSKKKWEKYFLKKITPLYHHGFELDKAVRRNSTTLSRKVSHALDEFHHICLRYVTNAVHFSGEIMLDTQDRLWKAFELVQRAMRVDLHIDDLEQGMKARFERQGKKSKDS